MKQPTVTQGNWNVSVCDPAYDFATGQTLRGVQLNTFQFHDRKGSPKGRMDMQRRGDGDGRIFPTADDAWKWALTHGYLQVYYKRVWCREHRRLHTFLGKPTPICFKKDS